MHRYFDLLHRYHPELVELRRQKNAKDDEAKKLDKALVGDICEKFFDLEGHFTAEAIHHRTNDLKNLKEKSWFLIPMLNNCLQDAEKLLERGTEGLSIKDCAANLINLVADHSAFLGGLLDLDEEDQKSSKVLKTNFKKLAAISKCLQPLLETEAFSLSRSENIQKAIRAAGEEIKKAHMRIETTMVSQAQVMMSTIGSSHKLPVEGGDEYDDDDNNDPDGLGVIFSEMRLSDDKTIVIFDEAGCIPAYELIGLSRLGRQIDALVAVGDEHQLPPYNPNENSFRKNASRSPRATPRRAGAKLKSILDVSRWD
jgi:hypothetical protein